MKYFDEIFAYSEGEMSLERQEKFIQQLHTDKELQKEYAAYSGAKETFKLLGQKQLIEEVFDKPNSEGANYRRVSFYYAAIFLGLVILSLLIYWGYPNPIKRDTIILDREQDQVFYNVEKGNMIYSIPPSNLSENRVVELDSYLNKALSHNNIFDFYLKGALISELPLNFLSENEDEIKELISELFKENQEEIEKNWNRYKHLVPTIKQQFDWRFNHTKVIDKFRQPVIKEDSMIYYYYFHQDKTLRANEFKDKVDIVAYHPSKKIISSKVLDDYGNIQIQKWKSITPFVSLASINTHLAADTLNAFMWGRNSVNLEIDQIINTYISNKFDITDILGQMVDGVGYTIHSPLGTYTLMGGIYSYSESITNQNSLEFSAQLLKGVKPIASIPNLPVSWRDYGGTICKFSDNEKYLVFTLPKDKTTLHILSLTTIEEIKISFDHPICNINFNHKNKNLLHVITKNNEFHDVSLDAGHIIERFIIHQASNPLEKEQALIKSTFGVDLVETNPDSTLFYSLFSSNSKYVLNAYNLPPFFNRFTLINKENKEVIFDSYRYYYAAFSKDSRYLLLSQLAKNANTERPKGFHDLHNEYRLYDLEKGQFVGKVITESHSIFSLFDFSPNGKYIIISNEKGLESWEIIKSPSGEIELEKEQLEVWDNDYLPYPFYFPESKAKG